VLEASAGGVAHEVNVSAAEFGWMVDQRAPPVPTK